MYAGSVFKISRKENKESAGFKNFGRFHGFSLYYESVELAEGWFSYLFEKKSK